MAAEVAHVPVSERGPRKRSLVRRRVPTTFEDRGDLEAEGEEGDDADAENHDFSDGEGGEIQPGGPVLSANKKLIAERKVKGEAKKEKLMAGGKGHVKPANYLDSHKKFLIGVATKGGAFCFEMGHFFLILSLCTFAMYVAGVSVVKLFNAGRTSGTTDEEGPAWAPLRDNYMLTNSKLKDWDKMSDTTIADDDFGRMSEEDGTSDDEDDD
ncbi:hypothetical protein JRO89_XS01G0114800 [Xanthoceras sorbifolium]|uniref:Uncharacterized protein n=1 Tax=Xanthoceras sorbifolium TaxID=99658 RepID=A0ABQ8IIV2_9ROSI|nr:hypothetical protein JRO89_XS01G0114800 [Xanthoceras sorbifolium]